MWLFFFLLNIPLWRDRCLVSIPSARMFNEMQIASGDHSLTEMIVLLEIPV